jgi:hypothetical protein
MLLWQHHAFAHAFMPTRFTTAQNAVCIVARPPVRSCECGGRVHRGCCRRPLLPTSTHPRWAGGAGGGAHAWVTRSQSAVRRWPVGVKAATLP